MAPIAEICQDLQRWGLFFFCQLGTYGPAGNLLGTISPFLFLIDCTKLIASCIYATNLKVFLFLFLCQYFPAEISLHLCSPLVRL